MIVAAGTLHGESKKNRRDGVDSVGHVFDSVLLLDDPTFGVVSLIAQKARGDLLFQAGIRKQIPCELLGEKLVVWHVLAIGVDHPITPRPHLTILVVVVTVGVCIARQIEPLGSHPFGVSIALEQTIHGFLVSIS